MTSFIAAKRQEHGSGGWSSFASRLMRGHGWLCLALVLYLVQVVPFPSRQWVTDESWYAAPGYSIVHHEGMRDPAIGPNDMENHFYVRPPGTALVIAFFYKLFGTGQAPARIGSMIAGFVIVILTYKLASRMMGKQGAVFATLFVATDNFIVLTSRTARPEAMATMSLVAALVAINRYRDGRLVYAVAGGFLIALGSMFHATLVGYIVSLAIFAIVIDRQNHFPLLRGWSAYTLSFLMGLLPFGLWVFTQPLGPQAFQGEYFQRVRKEPIFARLLAEQHRYVDFMGYNRLHGHGLEAFPARFPIPLLLAVGTFVLWRYRRRWFYAELLLLVPTMLWFVDTYNKSSRYISNLSPVFALVVGAAIAATTEKRVWHRALMAASGLAIAAQFGANLLLLRGVQKANYNNLTAELRSVVPPGKTVYGTITFWLAFHDHPYISYERTDPWMAAKDFHVRYFIGGDRMMSMGSPSDGDFYRTLNQHFKEVTANSTVVGHFPDPYYGDLYVYKTAP